MRYLANQELSCLAHHADLCIDWYPLKMPPDDDRLRLTVASFQLGKVFRMSRWFVDSIQVRWWKRRSPTMVCNKPKPLLRSMACWLFTQTAIMYAAALGLSVEAACQVVSQLDWSMFYKTMFYKSMTTPDLPGMTKTCVWNLDRIWWGNCRLHKKVHINQHLHKNTDARGMVNSPTIKLAQQNQWVKWRFWNMSGRSGLMQIAGFCRTCTSLPVRMANVPTSNWLWRKMAKWLLCSYEIWSNHQPIFKKIDTSQTSTLSSSLSSAK